MSQFLKCRKWKEKQCATNHGLTKNSKKASNSSDSNITLENTKNHHHSPFLSSVTARSSEAYAVDPLQTAVSFIDASVTRTDTGLPFKLLPGLLSWINLEVGGVQIRMISQCKVNIFNPIILFYP